LKTCDFLVVGGGVVGLTAARAIARRKLGTVVLLEKEPALGVHTSGRNSGVLHAGLYYAPDSFKAKLCLAGNRMMREYAAAAGFTLRSCGKVVVAPTPAAAPEVDRLYERAVKNGVRVELIDEKRLTDIEPEARTCGKAIWSPDTAVFDPHDVIRHLEADVTALGVDVFKSTELHAVDPGKGEATAGSDRFAFGHLVNAAGLHADRVASLFGAGGRYRILPFKGLYKKIRPGSACGEGVRGIIYTVPDPRVPFLGAQALRDVHGDVIVGPTAIPAFGRENYGVFKGLDVRDSFVMARDVVRMLARNPDGFRNLVFREAPRYTPGGFLKSARELLPRIGPRDLVPFDRVGLRAQLVEKSTLRLVNDFIVESAERSTHVLNAVSPAFTSSLAFAEHLTDRIVSG